jgi:hypothetical protein
MMSTNTEREMRWIKAWNDLFYIIGTRKKVDCLLPDGSIVDIETCQGWLQNAAYDGYRLKIEEGWIKGKLGVLVSSFNEL